MEQTPILIAGAGPVGMTIALDLARRGVRSIVVERNATTTKHPKMDITNGRSMELFRALGIADELRAVAVPSDHRFDVSWITDFAGSELFRFVYPSVDEKRQEIASRNDGSQPLEPSMRVSQVEIEPVLKRALEREPLVDLRHSNAFVSFEEKADGVIATILDVTKDVTYDVQCQFLVGADGGTSVVRKQLDIGLSGPGKVSQRLMTHFRSTQLDVLQRWGVAWHYQSRLGTLIAQNDRDIWTLHTRVNEEDPETQDPRAAMRRFFGTDIEADILVWNVWMPYLLVADKYAQGRVFLAGDAAHQYIPTGGYGMNTGIGDATNLSWKLAAVVNGYAGEPLLASYEPERRPVGLRNCQAAGANNDVRTKVAALYTDDIYLGGDAGDAARQRAGAGIEALGNLENEAWGIEYGYVYATSPVIVAEPDAAIETDPAIYRPTTVPGARLPSSLLADGTAVYDKLGPWLTLLCFAENAAIATFEAAAAEASLPLTVVRIDDPAISGIYEAPLVLVRPDHHVAWRGDGIADVTAGTAILDQVLGRTDQISTEQPAETLSAQMSHS